MFILVYFGYKQHRIFTIDCLTASLMDYIAKLCMEEMVDIIAKKEEQHSKEIGNLQKKLASTERKLEKVEQQIKDEDDKRKLEEYKQAQETKDPKAKNAPAKPAAPAKKGGKDAQNQSPLEAEKAEVLKEIENIKMAIEKYSGKVVGLRDLHKKLPGFENAVLDLVDKTGERKFAKTKLDTIANTFLSDKGSYYLVKISPPEQGETEEKVELVALDGYPIRTLEEDATYVEGGDVVLKGGKDSKKGKKK